MGTGWRRAFCNTIPRDRKEEPTTHKSPSPRLARSTPSTPRLRCNTFPSSHSNASVNTSNNLVSPKLQCKTTTPKSQSKTLLRCKSSSPRSPFSILKNTLRLSKNNCGVCMQSVKTGQGTAMYTAECSHTFHFPCIASHVNSRNQNNDDLICPVCNTTWKHIPLLKQQNQQHPQDEKIVTIDESSTTPKQQQKTPISSPKYRHQNYSDDEPLVTPRAGTTFVPIPETNEDEHEEIEEFQGFLVNPILTSDNETFNRHSRNVEVTILPEAAVISTHDTYVVVLKAKAPPNGTTPARAPIDLVATLDVSSSMIGAKLQMLHRAMRLVISSLGPTDRLSIVSFSASPKRLLPLTRMTAHGQRSARRIVDQLSCGGGTCVAEALKQATKVLEDRRERNPVASIILLSGGQNDCVQSQRSGPSHVSNSSTRFAHVEIPRVEDAFSKCVGGLLSVVVRDLKVRVGFVPGSDPAEISAVYLNQRAGVYDPSCVCVGDLYAEEEREILVEIRVPRCTGSHHVFSIKCCYKDPGSRELVYGGDHALLLPKPQNVGLGLHKIEQLRNAFIMTRAVAESRRLVEHEEVSSAMQLLASARGLLLQSRSESAEECVRGLEAELAEVEWRIQCRREMVEKGEPMTPMSASRSSERLAKVNDMHGFENARF